MVMKSWLIKVRPDKTLKENSGKDYYLIECKKADYIV